MDLTFKEYLASKVKLREAVKTTPKQKIQYKVKKYCKLPIGESKDTKEVVSLKPKQTLIIEWSYDNFDSPTPLKIMLDGIPIIPIWNQTKFEDWLYRNTTEQPKY